MSTEVAGAIEWVGGRLLATPGITTLIGDRVYHTVADQGSAYPYVLVVDAGSTDSWHVGGERVLSEVHLYVAAFDRSEDPQRVVDLWNLIDDALQAQAGSATYARVYQCDRQSSSFAKEIGSDGQPIYRYGGVYRCFAQDPATP